MNKPEGKTALITGGTSGIGLAATKAFVNEGAYTFITEERLFLSKAVSQLNRRSLFVKRNRRPLEGFGLRVFCY